MRQVRRRTAEKVEGGSNSRVTIPLSKHLFFQPFRSGIVTASGDTFITKNKKATRPSALSLSPPPIPLRSHPVTVSFPARKPYVLGPLRSSIATLTFRIREKNASALSHFENDRVFPDAIPRDINTGCRPLRAYPRTVGDCPNFRHPAAVVGPGRKMGLSPSPRRFSDRL